MRLGSRRYRRPSIPASALGQLSWALFDAGRGPYSILINTFVFSAYFTTVVFADPVRGQEVWSYLTSVGAFLVALGAPILGAIADAGGRRKPWLARLRHPGRALHGCPLVRIPRHGVGVLLGVSRAHRCDSGVRVFGHLLQRHAAERVPARAHRFPERAGLGAGQPAGDRRYSCSSSWPGAGTPIRCSA